MVGGLGGLALEARSCFGLPTGSGGGGATGNCTPECNGESTGCPQLSSSTTALDALHQAQPLAQSLLPAAPRWMGALLGSRLTRDGKPTQEPEYATVLGQQTPLYTSGWVFKYCANSTEVAFGAGPPMSTGKLGCGLIDCNRLVPTAEPLIDSAAAIVAAFPSDPANTLYGLLFDEQARAAGRLSPARVWVVTRLPQGPAVLVDADTGAVVQ